MAAAAAAGMLAAAPARSQSAAPAPQPPAAGAAGPANVGQLVEQYLQQDRQTLMAGRAQADQDEAARRLVNRQSSQAREYLRAALQAADNPRAQLAAARAAADDPSPDPRWADLLEKMLGAEALTKDAVAALLNLRTDDAVNRVRAFVTRDPQVTQASALWALGRSTDIRVAETLVGLVRGNAAALKRNYAADALAEMTGLSDNGRDPAAWAAWWEANRAKGPDRFRADLLDRRARRPAAPADPRLLADVYGLVADKDKPAALRRMLDSTDPAGRAAGVRLLYASFTKTGKVPEGVPRVRDLIRDSAPDVRLEAARTLGNLNDKPSLEPLLAQLRVETDPAVRAALVQALVQMQDARSAPELVRLLNDPSVGTATLAAETLAKIGGEVRRDKRLAADVGRALVDAVNRRAARDSSGDLQGACVEALVPLQDPQHRALFLNLMGNPDAPARVRKAAAAGLGEVGTRDDAAAAFDIVRNDRADVGVRIAALGAMERLRDPGFADELFRLSRQQGPDDAGIKRAAGRAFEALLPQAADGQLDAWADQLARANDYGPRVPVLAEKARRLAAAGPGRAAELAQVRESIGEAHVRAGQPQQAIEPFRQALQYWQDQKAPQRVYVGVRDRLLDAYLQAGLYAPAVQYAQRVVADGLAAQSDVVPYLANEVDRLNQQARQPAKAAQLAAEALKFPGLEEPSRARLTRGLEAARQSADAPP